MSAMVAVVTRENNQRISVIVIGRVQGVGFRASTLERARRLGLLGWVRNRHDGSVEVVAEGPRATLKEFLAYLNQGPPMAHVASVKVDWEEARGEPGETDGFDVRPTQ